MSHSAPTVITCLKQIIPEIKSLDPDMATVHYWTDSPSSQYRNKSIFNLIANHESMFCMKAQWNYFESGHGKGPCDGLGGTCKRMADEAVGRGNIIIQDAQDFHAWAIQSSLKKVNFIFVSTQKCQKEAEAMKRTTLKPIKGTMKIHAVAGLGESKIMVRETSCYCKKCLSALYACERWREESTAPQEKKEKRASIEIPASASSDHDVQEPNNSNSSAKQNLPTVNTGDFVVAIYAAKWYIGEVVSVDPVDKEYEISFMEQKKTCFQWPRRPDKIWVQNKDILTTISHPEPTGKSKRLYRIPLEIAENINHLFYQHQAM